MAEDELYGAVRQRPRLGRERVAAPARPHPRRRSSHTRSPASSSPLRKRARMRTHSRMATGHLPHPVGFCGNGPCPWLGLAPMRVAPPSLSRMAADGLCLHRVTNTSHGLCSGRQCGTINCDRDSHSYPSAFGHYLYSQTRCTLLSPLTCISCSSVTQIVCIISPVKF